MTNGALAFPTVEAQDSVQFRADGIPGQKIPPASFGMDWFGFQLQLDSILDDLPAWWSPARDVYLRNTYHDNSFLAAMVYGESVRVKNMPFQLNDESGKKETLLEAKQDMLNRCNFGTGFPTLALSTCLDMLTQDNGAFWELIGDDRNTEQELKTEVKHLAYLDAGQIWRTYDPEYPIIYINPYDGKPHVFHYTRCVTFSPFRQGRELARGLQLCALSRAYEAYRMVRGTNLYVYEKVMGQSPEVFVSNVPQSVLKSALFDIKQTNDNLGFRAFKGAGFIAPANVMQNQPEMKITKVGIKDAGDGFNHREEIEMAVYAMCAAFGVDAREYVPGTRVGETKADAELQDVKAEAKGLTDLMNSIENALNWRVLPPEITFKFEMRNLMTEKREAEARQIRVATRAQQIQSGELILEEARQLAAESGDIDPAFLERQTVAGDNESLEGQAQADESEPATIGAIQDDPDPDTNASAEKSVTDYRARMRRLVRGYWNGTISRYDFTDGMVSAIYNNFSDAWLAGAKAVGVNRADITPAQWNILRNEINNQYNYVTGYADAIYANNRNEGGRLSELFSRADMWLNQYERIKSKAMIELAGNKRLKWIVSSMIKNHCDDCGKLDGRVYTAKVWKQAKIEPRSHELACGGWKCGCGFEVTTDPITPGRPPQLSGSPRGGRGGLLSRLFGFLGR